MENLFYEGYCNRKPICGFLVSERIQVKLTVQIFIDEKKLKEDDEKLDDDMKTYLKNKRPNRFM